MLLPSCERFEKKKPTPNPNLTNKKEENIYREKETERKTVFVKYICGSEREFD